MYEGFFYNPKKNSGEGEMPGGTAVTNTVPNGG